MEDRKARKDEEEEEGRRFVSIYPSVERGRVGAKRSSPVCMEAMVEAPLACLRCESRGSLSDVLCGTIRIVLYARDVP